MADSATPASATILHVDIDAFYVSMELLRRPELRGKPVIVAGGLGNRGVVNTCSYEARRFGVHSAMPVSQARRLCPHGVYLPSDYGYYAPASARFHEILHEYTPLVESAGADEAYLDVAGCERLHGSPVEIASAIRRRVHDELGITASVGVATSKLVAKVASDAEKPDGLCVVEAGEEAAFLAPRPIRDLPGIGRVAAQGLAALGISLIGDLQVASPDLLARRFGPHGVELHRHALGRSSASVRGSRASARTISRERTFDTDVGDEDALIALLHGQCERVCESLAAEHRSARTAILKLRFPPFETLTRSATPRTPIAVAADLFPVARALFEEAWHANYRRPVRLLGIGVANLHERARQLRLGEEPADRLDSAVSGLRGRFGRSALRSGIELAPRKPGEPFEHH